MGKKISNCHLLLPKTNVGMKNNGKKLRHSMRMVEKLRFKERNINEQDVHLSASFIKRSSR